MSQVKEEKKSNFKFKIGVLICLIALMLLFVSYGYFYVSSNQSDRNRLTGGCFNPTFTDGSSISLTNAVPMTNEEGLKSTPYDFTLTNSCQTNVKYYVILNIKDGSMDPKNISVSYDGQTSFRLDTLGINTKESGKTEGYTTSYVLKQDLLSNGSKTEHIRLWLNDEADYNELQSGSNTFTAEVKVVEGVGSFLGTDKILSLVKGANTSSTDVIEKSVPEGATCTNTLAYDGTVDNNLRYVGSNPCNYVSFNNELWRIIGVMNNVDDGTGKTESRIKLIRRELLGRYSWDTSDSSVNSGWGVNDWSHADLMHELNGDYLDTSLSTNVKWYNDMNNQKEGIYNYTKTLNPLFQDMISEVKWYLGGIDSNTYGQDSVGTARNLYVNERETTVWGSLGGQTCNDEACPRATSWTGKVALIYPSDYGFAVGGNVRSICLNKTLYKYNSDNCSNNNWIFNSNLHQWVLSPTSNYAYSGFRIYNDGFLRVETVRVNYSVLPSLYLKPSVSITNGNGSEENPYILE